MCDNHPDVPAVGRTQGETDSFGSEQHDLCATCLEKARADRRTAREGQCDWCKQHAVDLRHRRDIDEGSSGRVYDVCGACVATENEALRAELDEYDDWGGR